MSETKTATNEYSTKSPADVKVNVMERLQQLLHKAREKATRARRVYKANFDCRVKHARAFQMKDTVYLNEPPAGNRWKTTILRPRSIGKIEVEEVRSICCDAVDALYGDY